MPSDLYMQDLRQRIRDSYEARWKAEKHFNEEEILEELPSSLRTEACRHLAASWTCWIYRSALLDIAGLANAHMLHACF